MAEDVSQVLVTAVCHYRSFLERRGDAFMCFKDVPMFVDDLLYRWVLLVKRGREWGAFTGFLRFILEQCVSVDVVCLPHLRSCVVLWVASVLEFAFHL